MSGGYLWDVRMVCEELNMTGLGIDSGRKRNKPVPANLSGKSNELISIPAGFNS